MSQNPSDWFSVLKYAQQSMPYEKIPKEDKEAVQRCIQTKIIQSRTTQTSKKPSNLSMINLQRCSYITTRQNQEKKEWDEEEEGEVYGMLQKCLAGIPLHKLTYIAFIAFTTSLPRKDKSQFIRKTLDNKYFYKAFIGEDGGGDEDATEDEEEMYYFYADAETIEYIAFIAKKQQDYQYPNYKLLCTLPVTDAVTQNLSGYGSTVLNSITYIGLLFDIFSLFSESIRESKESKRISGKYREQVAKPMMEFVDSLVPLEELDLLAKQIIENGENSDLDDLKSKMDEALKPDTALQSTEAQNAYAGSTSRLSDLEKQIELLRQKLQKTQSGRHRSDDEDLPPGWRGRARGGLPPPAVRSPKPRDMGSDFCVCSSDDEDLPPGWRGRARGGPPPPGARSPKPWDTGSDFCVSSSDDEDLPPGWRGRARGGPPPPGARSPKPKATPPGVFCACNNGGEAATGAYFRVRSFPDLHLEIEVRPGGLLCCGPTARDEPVLSMPCVEDIQGPCVSTEGERVFAAQCKQFLNECGITKIAANQCKLPVSGGVFVWQVVCFARVLRDMIAKEPEDAASHTLGCISVPHPKSRSNKNLYVSCSHHPEATIGKGVQAHDAMGDALESMQKENGNLVQGLRALDDYYRRNRTGDKTARAQVDVLHKALEENRFLTFHDSVKHWNGQALSMASALQTYKRACNGSKTKKPSEVVRSYANSQRDVALPREIHTILRGASAKPFN